MGLRPVCFFLFFFNDTATTEIYTLSLHDALPIRRFLLRHRYREDWAFREKDLKLEADGGVSAEGGQTRFDPEADRVEFFEALEQDLDTPRALAVLDRAAASSETSASHLLAEGRAILGL